MALAGVGALWAGMQVGLGRRLRLNYVRDFSPTASRWGYLRVLLVVGSLVALYPRAEYVFGSSGQQIMDTFINTIPTMVFIFLFWNVLRGRAVSLDRYAVLVFLGFQFVIGLSSGWLGAFLQTGIAFVSVYLLEHRRIPKLPIVLLAVYVLFFQVGKGEFRSAYWLGQTPDSQSAGYLNKVTSWIGDSWSGWQYILSQQGGVTPAVFHDTVERTSLLAQTANVIDYTPRVVPYQYGATYSYLAAAWIPRFVWANKPSASEANQFYQLRYGLTSAQGLSSTSIAVGVLTEGYINFGLPGALVIMFLIGILFDWVRASFLAVDRGRYYAVLGTVILMHLIIIESQMAFYISFVENMILAYLVFWPATERVLGNLGGSKPRSA